MYLSAQQNRSMLGSLPFIQPGVPWAGGGGRVCEDLLMEGVGANPGAVPLPPLPLGVIEMANCGAPSHS